MCLWKLLWQNLIFKTTHITYCHGCCGPPSFGGLALLHQRGSECGKNRTPNILWKFFTSFCLISTGPLERPCLARTILTLKSCSRANSSLQNSPKIRKRKYQNFIYFNLKKEGEKNQALLIQHRSKVCTPELKVHRLTCDSWKNRFPCLRFWKNGKLKENTWNNLLFSWIQGGKTYFQTWSTSWNVLTSMCKSLDEYRYKKMENF